MLKSNVFVFAKQFTYLWYHI